MAENENSVIVSEMRERSESELHSLLDAKREDLQKLRFKHSLGQLRETHQLRSLKRDVARLNTVLRERTSSSQGEQK